MKGNRSDCLPTQIIITEHNSTQINTIKLNFNLEWTKKIITITIQCLLKYSTYQITMLHDVTKAVQHENLKKYKIRWNQITNQECKNQLPSTGQIISQMSKATSTAQARHGSNLASGHLTSLSQLEHKKYKSSRHKKKVESIYLT